VQHPNDEVAIDLDSVHLERAQRLVRRVPGSEAVDGDRDAFGAKVGDRVGAPFGVGHQRPFGDFEFEPARREPGVGERLQRLAREARILEIADRDVQRQPGVITPGHQQTAGGDAQDRVGDRSDQVRVLSEPDEVQWCDRAVHRVLPPHERFDGDDAAVVHRQLRLVVDA
jgi:hypothetical protein